MHNSMKTILTLATASFLLISTSLSAQIVGGKWDMMLKFKSQNEGGAFGTSIAKGPDINGDGFPEFVVGSPMFENAAGMHIGLAQMISGRTGEVLWATSDTTGSYSESNLGYELCFVPDLNGDGIPEVVSGNPSSLAGKGKVFLLNGADGVIIREHDGWLTSGFNQSTLGKAVLGIPDVDNDGFGDYLLSAPNAESNGVDLVGQVECRSGFTGSVLWQTSASGITRSFGRTLSIGPDLDGDGIEEIITSSRYPYSIYFINPVTGDVVHTIPSPPGHHNSGFGVSVALVPDIDSDNVDDIVVGSIDIAGTGGLVAISTATGMSLWNNYGTYASGALGGSVKNVGDLNNDGVDDIASSEQGPSFGVIRIVSGINGETLWELKGREQAIALYKYPISSYDRTGDGRLELVIGDYSVPGEINGYSFNGFGGVAVISFSPYLSSDTSILSATQSRNLELDLEFPLDMAMDSYLILASETSNSATSFWGVDIPLEIDSFSYQIYQSGPSAFGGTLDAAGKAHVSVQVPRSSITPLLGKTVYFAAVAGSSRHNYRSSVAVPVLLVP